MDRCFDSKQLRDHSGFTLLEVTLAMALGMVLLVGIFAVASGTTQMTDEISEFQTRETQKQAFTDICRRTLKSLGSDAAVTLELNSTANGYLTKLIIDRDPLAFSFSAVPPGAARIVLQTEPMPGGNMAVWLRYLNEQEKQEMERGSGEKLGTPLRLLKNVSTFEWRFFDRVTGEWSTVWEPGGERPGLVDLNLGFDGESPMRYVFWIPRYEQAEALIRGFQQNQLENGTPGEAEPEVNPEGTDQPNVQN